MSRVFDFTVLVVVYIIAAIIHLMGVELLAPGSPLYSIATTDTAAMNGQELADQWYQIISVWVPMIGVFGMTAYVMVREYRRQALTAVSRTP